jgi:hypothetical protein
MTSGIFTGNIAVDEINNVSTTVYPGISSILTGQYSDSDTGLTVTWKITQAPSFTLAPQPPGLTVQIAFNVTTEPGDGNADASAQATVLLQNASSQDHLKAQLALVIQQLTFDSVDPLLKAVLQANEITVRADINRVLAAFPLSLGPFGTLSIAGVDISATTSQPSLSATLCTEQQDVGNIPSLDALSMSGKISLGCDSAFPKKILDAVWWPTVDKEWDVGPAEVWLDSYTASVSNGTLELTLSLGGKFEVPYMWGTARWKLDIDSVKVTATLGFDGNDYVIVTGSSVSKPKLSPKPDNAGAWVLGFFYGPLVAVGLAIGDAITSGAIHDAITDTLDQPLYKIPSSTQSVDGHSIHLQAKDLSFDYNDAWPLIVRGTVDVTVDPPVVSDAVIMPYIWLQTLAPYGQLAAFPGGFTILAGLGQSRGLVSLKQNDEEALIPSQMVDGQGNWDYPINYTPPTPGTYTVYARQTFGGVTSEPFIYTVTFVEGPIIDFPPDTQEFASGSPVSLSGTAMIPELPVKITMNDQDLPNSLIYPDAKGQWSYGPISPNPDVGSHTLTVSVVFDAPYNVVQGPSTTHAFTVAAPPSPVPQPIISLPVEDYSFDEDQAISVVGTATPKAYVLLSIDSNPMPQGPTQADNYGNWAFSNITAPAPGSHMLSVIQDLNGIESQPATRHITVVAAGTGLPPPPDFIKPQQNQQYWWPAPVTIAGTAQAGATINVKANGVPLSNGPTTADNAGNWGYSNAHFQSGFITLTAIQTVNGVDSQPATRNILMHPGS